MVYFFANKGGILLNEELFIVRRKWFVKRWWNRQIFYKISVYYFFFSTMWYDECNGFTNIIIKAVWTFSPLSSFISPISNGNFLNVCIIIWSVQPTSYIYIFYAQFLYNIRNIVNIHRFNVIAKNIISDSFRNLQYAYRGLS